VSGHDGEFSLILGFDSDDPEFIRGFEAGRLYEQLKSGEEIVQTIHASNTEMAIRICERAERQFTADQLDDHWTALTVLAAQPETSREEQ
jgi:hypothetical protein